MSSAFNDILTAAVSLTEEERVDDSLVAEIERRSAEIDAGTATFVTWDKVKENARCCG